MSLAPKVLRLASHCEEVAVELLRHQASLGDPDGVFVCSRCGLINPSEDQPCIPANVEPSSDPYHADEEEAA